MVAKKLLAVIAKTRSVSGNPIIVSVFARALARGNPINSEITSVVSLSRNDHQIRDHFTFVRYDEKKRMTKQSPSK